MQILNLSGKFQATIWCSVPVVFKIKIRVANKSITAFKQLPLFFLITSQICKYILAKSVNFNNVILIFVYILPLKIFNTYRRYPRFPIKANSLFAASSSPPRKSVRTPPRALPVTAETHRIIGRKARRRAATNHLQKRNKLPRNDKKFIVRLFWRALK